MNFYFQITAFLQQLPVSSKVREAGQVVLVVECMAAATQEACAENPRARESGIEIGNFAQQDGTGRWVVRKLSTNYTRVSSAFTNLAQVVFRRHSHCRRTQHKQNIW